MRMIFSIECDVTLLLCEVSYCCVLNMVSEYAVAEVANVHNVFGQACDSETGSLPLPGHIATQEIPDRKTYSTTDYLP
jgi:hypothetical protein